MCHFPSECIDFPAPCFHSAPDKDKSCLPLGICPPISRTDDIAPFHLSTSSNMSVMVFSSFKPALQVSPSLLKVPTCKVWETLN